MGFMKFFRFLVGLALVPVALAAVYTAFEKVLVFGANAKINTLPFWIGIVFYVLFQFIFAKPLRTYVFGHELTHALAGLISGAALKKFKVTNKGGSVTLDKNNVWITLSPYFLPLYSIIVMLAYLFLGFLTDPAAYKAYFIFLIGFTTAFHFALTYYAIKIGQEDLRIYGRFFSLMVIITINAVTLTLVLAVIFPEYVNIFSLFTKSAGRTVSIFHYLWDGITTIWQAFQKTN
jgi:hypothetical protein